MSPAQFNLWRRDRRVFDDISAVRSAGLTLTGAGEAEQLMGMRVSQSFFGLFGVPMQGGASSRVMRTCREARASSS
jgi:phosphoribosylcarboxyaminoimidazole (NCAIR) mutase